MPFAHNGDRKTTLVIVEDNATVGYLLQRGLEPQHQILASVGDGAAAVQAVNEHHPDIVLLDISMPIMNGLDAAECIAKSCPFDSIIIVTSHTDRGYVEAAFDRGAVGYVRKGSIADLQDAIRTVLDGQRYWPAFCR